MNSEMASFCKLDSNKSQSDWTQPMACYEAGLKQTLSEVFENQSNTSQQSSGPVYLIISMSQNTIIFQCVLAFWALISFVGTFCNGINILVFVRMGLEDSVTVSFLGLSVSDFLLLITAIVHIVSVGPSWLDREHGYWYYVKPMVVTFQCAHIREIFSVNTTVITMFLAVQRCFCIAKPLHFKGVFTRARAMYALCVAAVFSLLCYIPLLAFERTIEVRNKRTNRTQIVLSFAKGWNTVTAYNEMLVGIFLPCFSQVVVLLCLLVMIRCLKQSAQFRNRAVLTDNKGDDYDCQKEQQTTTDKGEVKLPDGKTAQEETGNTKKQTVLSRKDRGVIMQVLLICLIFILCNSPKIAIAITRLLVEGFDHVGPYQYLYISMKTLRTPFELTNSAVNTFIYYKYNTKFRVMFCHIIPFFNHKRTSQGM